MDMKKQIFLVASLVLLFSCSPEDNTHGGDTGTKNLIISATIDDDTLSFKAGDEMGLFVTTPSGDKYGDIESNIKAQYNTNWKTAMSGSLSGEPAKVYAYYPYTEKADLKAVPVVTDGKTPVLYGVQTEEEISNANNSASLHMKHALSTIAFNFSKKNYYGAGRLEKIEVLNAEGKKVFASRGMLDCTTGKISPIPEDTAKVVKDCKLTVFSNEFTNILTGLREFPLIRSIPEGQPDENNIQYLRVLPMETLQSDGDIVFRITIDGVVYSCPVKAGTTWKQGETSFYTFTLEGEEINLDEMFNITWAEPGNSELSHIYDYVPFPEEAKPAILHAMKIWAQCLDIKVPLKVIFGFATLDGGVMAESLVGSHYIDEDRNYRYPETLKNQIVGYDSEPYSSEIKITFNSKTWFYFGLDGKYLTERENEAITYFAADFLSTILHELGHSFGITSFLFANTEEQIGTKAIPEPYDISIFDSFMVDEKGKSLKDYPNRSNELYKAIISGKIVFAGPNAVKANNGKPVLLRTNNRGWDGSHLDGFNIMAAGEYHHPGTVILGMLQDIGWNVKPLPVLKEQN